MLNYSTFYLAFKDIHPSWSLIGCALTYGIIATFGVIFNSSVIAVTFQTKSLRGTVNYLLALCSFFEMLHQFGHFLFVYTAFSGQNFIEYRLATKFLMIPMFGLGGIYPVMLFIGIDRMIGIVFDEMHSKRKIRLYLATITFICSAFSFGPCLSFYQSIELNGDQMVIGTFADFFTTPPEYRFMRLLIIIITILIYLFVGLIIRIKSAGLPSADQINYRTLRAIFCIIIINVGGYCTNSIFFNFIEPSIASPITAWFGLKISGMLLNIGAASNAPILYFTSTEYRQAFQTVFPFLFKRISNVTQVIPLQNGPQLGNT
ncbi:hypothetical protein niasHS_003101 [Heterodera schachtii]|uniref:G_PROTEIN_RECEP_F1_2 domain-containing protein n=1 Tax=Heterodera schachtii TaxID=97005 RepID=A0ABD2K9T8_HETSC